MALTKWIVEIRTDECTFGMLSAVNLHTSFSFPLLATHQRTALMYHHNPTYGKAEPEYAHAITSGT